MIYAPAYLKYKTVPVDLPRMGGRLSGEVHMEAFQCHEYANGKSVEIPGTRRVAAHFDNLILNQGLEYYGTVGKSQTAYCHVGTGAAAESVADTALSAWLAVTGTESYTSYWAQGSPPYYGARRWKYRFSPGFGGGAVNINEVGFGAGNSMVSQQLTSRALTKDGGGSPTTIPVLAAEYLDVYYTRRNYPGHIVEGTGAPVDLTGTIDIAGTSYNFTMRPAFVTNSQWGMNIGTGFNITGTWFGSFSDQCRVSGSDATLGAVTNGISSASQDVNYYTGNTRLGTYTSFSYNRNITYAFDIDEGNVTGGIKGIEVGSSMGCYQILLDATVPKNSSKIFEFTQNWAWARK